MNENRFDMTQENPSGIADTVRGLEPFTVLDSDDFVTCIVPEFSPEMKRQAANVMAIDHIGVDDLTDEEFERLRLTPDRYRQHLEDPEDTGCYCEAKGWWCVDGDGPIEVLGYAAERTILGFIEDERMEKAAADHAAGHHVDYDGRCLDCWKEKREQTARNDGYRSGESDATG